MNVTRMRAIMRIGILVVSISVMCQASFLPSLGGCSCPPAPACPPAPVCAPAPSVPSAPVGCAVGSSGCGGGAPIITAGCSGGGGGGCGGDGGYSSGGGCSGGGCGGGDGGGYSGGNSISGNSIQLTLGCGSGRSSGGSGCGGGGGGGGYSSGGGSYASSGSGGSYATSGGASSYGSSYASPPIQGGGEPTYVNIPSPQTQPIGGGQAPAPFQQIPLPQPQIHVQGGYQESAPAPVAPAPLPVAPAPAQGYQEQQVAAPAPIAPAPAPSQGYQEQQVAAPAPIQPQPQIYEQQQQQQTSVQAAQESSDYQNVDELPQDGGAPPVNPPGTDTEYLDEAEYEDGNPPELAAQDGNYQGVRKHKKVAALAKAKLAKAKAKARGAETQSVDPKCNSEIMRKIILEQATENTAVSKRQIQKAAAKEIGGRIDVICSTGIFSYIVNTELFCEAESKGVTCLVYRQAS